MATIPQRITERRLRKIVIGFMVLVLFSVASSTTVHAEASFLMWDTEVYALISPDSKLMISGGISPIGKQLIKRLFIILDIS
jgi:hypothetical protein